jgi:hypothetical protein
MTDFLCCITSLETLQYSVVAHYRGFVLFLEASNGNQAVTGAKKGFYGGILDTDFQRI